MEQARAYLEELLVEEQGLPREDLPPCPSPCGIALDRSLNVTHTLRPNALAPHLFIHWMQN